MAGTDEGGFMEVKVEKRGAESADLDDEYLNISLASEQLEEEQKAAHEADTLPVDPQHRPSTDDENSFQAFLHSIPKQVHEGLAPVLLSRSAPLNPRPTKLELLKHALLCPPHGSVAKWLTYVILLLAAWGCAFLLLGEVAAPPSGSLFWILVIVIFALILGQVVSCVGIPSLLGMLLAGIVIKNIPGLYFDKHWHHFSPVGREIALIVILLRAGLGLDPHALRKLSGMVFRLAFIPCLMEAVTVAVASHILLDMPWTWAFMMGFVLAAVSPAVVVPCLLTIQKNGYGVDKGIPTLVIAAASIDDVLAISAFTLLLGLTFNVDTDVAHSILQVPKEAFIGLSFGMGWGISCILFPYENHGHFVPLRFFMLFSGGVLALFGSQALKVPGAGAIAVLVMAFTARVGWRHHGWTNENDPVSSIFSSIWFIFKPLLFALIGTEIRVSEMDPSIIGWGLCVLTVGLTLRACTTFFVVMGGDLAWKERFFVALAWLPKATVQAAIGSLALDTASKLDADDMRRESFKSLGLTILTVSVLSIGVTAPIGSAAIMLTHPFLLSREKKSNVDEDQQAEPASTC